MMSTSVFHSPLSFWDFGVCGAILGMTILGVHLGHAWKPFRSLVDYMLMGRRLTLPLFVTSLVATWYGGIFGVTQIAFESGIYNFLIQGAFWYVTYLIFAWWIIDKTMARPYTTLPDLVHKTIGPTSAIAAGCLSFINVLPVFYVMSIGLLLQTIFGFSAISAMIMGTTFIFVYTFFGGFRALVLSDVVYFFVMVSAVAMVAVLSITTFGGYSFLQSHLPETHFSPLGTQSLWTTVVWGCIALSTLIDPNFYHLCFASQNPRIAKRGIYISVVVWIVFDICTTLGGLYARAVLPNAPASQAYLMYALTLLPEGLRGFFLAGMAATILSTLDSFMFVASNILAHDLIARFFPTFLKHLPVWRHKVSFVITCALSIVIATFFDNDLKNVWFTLGSLSAACLLLPMLITYRYPRILSDRLFSISVFSGVGAVAIHTWVMPLLPVDGFYVGALATLSSIVLGTLLRHI